MKGLEKFKSLKLSSNEQKSIKGGENVQVYVTCGENTCFYSCSTTSGNCVFIRMVQGQLA